MGKQKAANICILDRRDYLPAAFGREGTMHVDALSIPVGSPRRLWCTPHRPIVWPRCHDGSYALSSACQTGRKKLLFSSTVVEGFLRRYVCCERQSIAESAMSQRIRSAESPGIACCGPAEQVECGVPSAKFVCLKSKSDVDTATLFAFARSMRRVAREFLSTLTVLPRLQLPRTTFGCEVSFQMMAGKIERLCLRADDYHQASFESAAISVSQFSAESTSERTSASLPPLLGNSIGG